MSGSRITPPADAKCHHGRPVCPECQLDDPLTECPACGHVSCRACATCHVCPCQAAGVPQAPSQARMVSQFRESATIGSRGWQGARAGARGQSESSD